MANIKQYAVAIVDDSQAQTSVTVQSGNTLSSVLPTGGTTPSAVVIPENFTESTISFLVAKFPTDTFVPLQNFDGTDFSITVDSTPVRIPLQASMFQSVNYVQISCGTTQTDTTTIDFCLSPLFQGLHG